MISWVLEIPAQVVPARISAISESLTPVSFSAVVSVSVVSATVVSSYAPLLFLIFGDVFLQAFPAHFLQLRRSQLPQLRLQLFLYMSQNLDPNHFLFPMHLELAPWKQAGLKTQYFLWKL